MKKHLQRLFAIALIGTLAACATSSPDMIQRGDAQRMSVVQDATVLSIRPVVVDGSQSGVGGVSGGVIGGIAGSSVGGHRESAIVGVDKTGLADRGAAVGQRDEA